MKNFKIIVLGIAIVLICGMLFTACGKKEEHFCYEYEESTTATCTQDGYKTYKCVHCGETYQEEDPATGHLYYDDYGNCTDCGVFCANIKYVYASIDYNEKNEEFYFYFSLTEGYERKLRVNATVDIRIENDEDEVVYSAQKKVTPDDYNSYLNAVVVIPVSELKGGNSKNGTFYYEVTTDTADFDEFELSIRGDLPEKDWTKECYLELPSLPNVITSYSKATLEITKIDYNFKKAFNKGKVYLTITFAGSRIDNSLDASRKCYIGYKLIDSEGYVVKSGSYYTPDLAPGEKFKDVAIGLDDLEPGEYTLVLMNVS